MIALLEQIPEGTFTIENVIAETAHSHPERRGVIK